MALICNGYRFGHIPHKLQGSLTTIYNGMGFRDISLTGRNRNITAGQGITSDKVGVPMGYLAPGSWILPQKAGNLSSHNNARGECTATLTLVQGMAIAGASAGTSMATATAKLVVAMSASAAGGCTVTGNLNAALWGSGQADGSCTVTGQKNALAWCTGQADGTCTASLNSYATGTLSGSIYVNQSEATVVQIVSGVWDAEVTDHEEVGTMGKAMGAAGTAGDPWITPLPGSYPPGTAGYIVTQEPDPPVVDLSEVLNQVVEGTVTVGDALRLIVAVMAGKASGGGTAAVAFRDLSDTKDRVMMTVDEKGNRSNVVLDLEE